MQGTKNERLGVLGALAVHFCPIDFTSEEIDNEWQNAGSTSIHPAVKSIIVRFLGPLSIDALAAVAAF
jgi:hypothetical protein